MQPDTRQSDAPLQIRTLLGPWIGVALSVAGITILRFSGFGQWMTLCGAILAVVSGAKLWNKIAVNRRVVLVIVPAIVAPLLFLIYFMIPHGLRV
jgi:hypothetical protein